jgi:hypothetical protein
VDIRDDDDDDGVKEAAMRGTNIYTPARFVKLTTTTITTDKPHLPDISHVNH